MGARLAGHGCVSALAKGTTLGGALRLAVASELGSEWAKQGKAAHQEDEFVWVVSGEVTLIDNSGETTLHEGECAAFPKNEANGHRLANRSSQMAVCLEIGSRSDTDVCTYSDIDMIFDSQNGVYQHTDGTPYSQ